MKLYQILGFLCLYSAFTGCSIEHAEEQVLSHYASGEKKTSIWVYPDGEILKRNEWYNDGIKELEIPYKNNEPHGEFKRWTGLGDLIMVGQYKNGKRHGKWTSYFSGHFNKKKEAERYYKDDHAIGDWTGWHHNGTKAFEEHYSDKGDSIGIWEKWYENGNIAEKNSCHHLDSAGSIQVYYENGKLKEFTTCKFGIPHGEHRLYTADERNEIYLAEEYSNGTINGARVFYLSLESPTQGHSHLPYKKEFWTNGIRDSIWRWEDGQGNLLKESIIINGTGIIYGQCDDNLSVLCAETSFIANIPGGSLDSSIFSSFVPGATLRYYKAGHSLRYEEVWQNGEIAESRSFYPDSVGGIMASQGFWEKNKRHGIWRNWYPNGVLKDSLTYVYGERIGEQFGYDSTGKQTIHKTENGKNRPVIMHIPQQ